MDAKALSSHKKERKKKKKNLKKCFCNWTNLKRYFCILTLKKKKNPRTMDLDSRPVVQILVSLKRTETQKVVILGVSQPTKPHFPAWAAFGKSSIYHIFTMFSNTWNILFLPHTAFFIFIYYSSNILLKYTIYILSIAFFSLNCHLSTLLNYVPTTIPFPFKMG